MDKTTLVEKDIGDGKILIENLDRSKFKLVGALWFYYPASDEWRLLLVSPLVDTIGPRQCYTIIQSVIEDLVLGDGISLGLDRVSVLSPKDKLIRLLKVAIRTGEGISTMRFTRNTINGVFIEDALIYRLC
jgi:hypothetical protein